jgi:DNA polymerase-3 subunit gamma/tau
MLSRQAFNGLLKTLEEPPDNVVFVFATTEIRKVPVTVLSRCQRFDLRRIDSDALAGHFAMVSKKEGVEIEPAAIDIIARAADGSVRDGLSLLDQAMAMSGKGITAAQIRDMLGLADRVAVFDLFDSVMSGDIAAALDRFQAMHRDGADPVIVIQDLLEVTHWLTRIKIAPALAEEPGVPEEERVRGAKISQSLTMPVLSRCWQMLLKGLGETQMAPAPFAAAEMLLIRMTHAADLPPPADLIKSLQSDTPAPTPVAASTAQSSAAPAATSLASGTTGPARPSSAAAHAVAADPAPLIGPEAVVAADMAGILRRYEDVIALFDEKREGIMTAHLRQDVHLVGFSQHRIEFRPGPNAPRDLANRMGRMLSDWTGERWIVSVSDAPGAPTLAEQSAAAKAQRLAEAERDPLVRAVKETFPGARIRGITDRPKGATPDNQENSET